METVVFIIKCGAMAVISVAVLGHKHWLRQLRVNRYFTGRKVERRESKRHTPAATDWLRFGNDYLPESAASGHFLAAGSSGSGKTNVQRLLLESTLKNILPGSDRRMLIYDAKGETSAYLNRIGVSAPVYSLNPFESRSDYPIAVAWDIGKDITSPLRANNLSHSLISGEASGANGYFVKAGRSVVSAVMKSFIRHAKTEWDLADLVTATTSMERMKEVLERDAEGQRIVEMFLGENNTGYGVATTVVADMELYSPIAALWQRTEQRLSIREWLQDDSVLLLGQDETASATLDVVNAQIFTVFVEEALSLSNSSTRRVGLWIDEAQESECILRTGKVQSFARKARSRGGCLFVSFQDIEGFRLAAGDQKAADSIVAQCNYKALLRQESFESADWCSKLVGQFEAIEVFKSESNSWRERDRGSEQRVVKEALLASEFYNIPETNPANGLTGVFVSSRLGANLQTIPSADVGRIVVTDAEEREHAVVYREESEQWMKGWTLGDKVRLGLREEMEKNIEVDAVVEQSKKKKLRLSTRKALEGLQVPETLF